MAETFKSLEMSNAALSNISELRQRMTTDGYIFIKRLVNPDAVIALRRKMLSVIQAGGWIADGTDPLDGIADISRKCGENDIGYTDVYHEVYKLQEFHEAGHWKPVLDTMRKLIDGPVFPHPLKIARIWFPKYTDHTTPAHQDYVHNQGSFDTYTCWIPVGACPIELGGLAVVPGSPETSKVLDHHFSLGAGGMAADVPGQDSEWHTTDYEPGDALIFHSLTAHKALPNTTENRLRVSLDNRYQSIHDPITEGLLKPHLNKLDPDGKDNGPLTWEEVYADWTTDELQYYWKDRQGPVIAKDQTYSDLALQEAFELARQGDSGARLRLDRLRRRDPLSENGIAAAALLDGSQ